MSVCGGFRGGFSFNRSMLTSVDFRHGGGGGEGPEDGGRAQRPATVQHPEEGDCGQGG